MQKDAQNPPSKICAVSCALVGSIGFKVGFVVNEKSVYYPARLRLNCSGMWHTFHLFRCRFKILFWPIIVWLRLWFFCLRIHHKFVIKWFCSSWFRFNFMGTEAVFFNLESSAPLEGLGFAGVWWFTKLTIRTTGRHNSRAFCIEPQKSRQLCRTVC